MAVDSTKVWQQYKHFGRIVQTFRTNSTNILDDWYKIFGHLEKFDEVIVAGRVIKSDIFIKMKLFKSSTIFSSTIFGLKLYKYRFGRI